MQPFLEVGRTGVLQVLACLILRFNRLGEPLLCLGTKREVSTPFLLKGVEALDQARQVAFFLRKGRLRGSVRASP